MQNGPLACVPHWGKKLKSIIHICIHSFWHKSKYMVNPDCLYVYEDEACGLVATETVKLV